jgi:hypothetical protein
LCEFGAVVGGRRIVLLTWSNDLMASQTFYLKIDLLNSEFSKDSNSQRYVVQVKDNEVGYEYNYSGFPFPDNSQESLTYTITDEELSEIIKYIKENGVNKSITENIPDDANGSSRNVKLSLLLAMDGQTIESKISGNYRLDRADGKTKGIIIKNKDYVDTVESLIRVIRLMMST